MNTTVIVEIAGMGLALHLPEPSLAAALAERYRDFLGSRAVALETHIQVQPAEPAPSVDPHISFDGEALQLSAPGFMAAIRAEVGHGQLTLTGGNLFEAVEYYLRCACALLALGRGGLMFHAAGVVRDGRAYLFFGHSGSGKTTVSRLSSARYLVLNDDLLVLLPEGAGWRVYATPFWNPTQVRPNRADAPLGSLLRLVQAPTVFLEPMSSGLALAEMFSSSPIIPLDPSRSAQLMAVLLRLLESVPAQRLHFLPDDSFWAILP